jgi:hypothetical protein
LDLDLAGFLLSLIALFTLMLGFNSERRQTAYMAGYMNRANCIEQEYGMSLLAAGRQAVRTRKLLPSNTTIFPFYYGVFALSWLVLFLLNVIR